jgi:hypothetical protein
MWGNLVKLSLIMDASEPTINPETNRGNSATTKDKAVNHAYNFEL